MGQVPERQAFKRVLFQTTRTEMKANKECNVNFVGVIYFTDESAHSLKQDCRIIGNMMTDGLHRKEKNHVESGYNKPVFDSCFF